MMDPRASQESLGLTQSTTTCPYEEKVVTDPTTARIVLTFLRDFVEQRLVYSQSPQGYYCPMTKCEASFTEPLLLIQHLFTCSELGKGEFECWKCCSWHRFPTNEKEWADWAGWKSTTPGFQRKRSLGSKMKETLTETLTLRRRNSTRKISIPSTGCSGNPSMGQTPVAHTAPSMISSTTSTAITTGMGGIASPSHQPTKFQSPGEMCEWNQLIGLNQAQMLSTHSIQELQDAYRAGRQTMPAFSQTREADNGQSTSNTAEVSGFSCTLDGVCFVTSEHHHHNNLDVKPDPGTGLSATPAACSCNSFDSSSATSVGLDDRSAPMMWSTDVDSSDTSNISSTRPSILFDQASSLHSSTNPSQGSLFTTQNLSPFSHENARLIAAGLGGGSSASLSSDIGALRSPHTATASLRSNDRSAATAFSPMSPLKSNDRPTAASSFASTPASGEYDQNDNLMDERENWYHHSQKATDSVILAPVSRKGGLGHLAVPAPATAPPLPTTTAAMPTAVQNTSTVFQDMAVQTHPIGDSQCDVLTASMDIDMDGMPSHVHQAHSPNSEQWPNTFMQGSTPLTPGFIPTQHLHQYENAHMNQLDQQNASIVTSDSVSIHSGIYPTASLVTSPDTHASNPRFRFMGSGVSQTESRPVSHHRHPSSSRTSIQPPKTPTSTIDDDVDPEDLVCDQCQWKPRGVRENLRGYLRKHKNVHKGLRLSCDIPGCKKSFSRLDNLKTHRREKHGIDDTVPVSKAASITSIDSAGVMAGLQMTSTGSTLPASKRVMTMDDYNSERLDSIMGVSGVSTTVIPMQPQHVLQAAATIAQAQAQAQAQARQQAQLQAQAQEQARLHAQHAHAHAHAHTHAHLHTTFGHGHFTTHNHAQAQAQAQAQAIAQRQMQVTQVQAQAAQAQAVQSQTEPPRPDSKRQRESFDHGGYRGVTGEHAALWPLMQI